MRIVPTNLADSSTFAQHELLFLDCWYGLTHEQSLDSYRVTCLNARTAIHELADEIRSGRLDDAEFEGICKEIQLLLERDPVVRRKYPNSVSVIEPLLKSPPSLPGSSRSKEKETEKEKNKEQLKSLQFSVADLAVELDKSYFTHLCAHLTDLVREKQVASLEPVVNAIISDLVSRGWTLQALHRWHQHFISEKARTFENNLSFMLRQLQRAPGEYVVILRISGGKNVRQLTQFHRFILSTSLAVSSDNRHEQRFLTPDVYTTFATGTFVAPDFHSAAIAARDELEPLLDALRFEFEPRLLEIDKNSFVTRSDGRSMLVQVTNPVPNPAEPIDEHGFSAFATKLSAVLSHPQLAVESRNRLETAYRRYRAGRDSHNYTEKFLNWWMGLEALASAGGTKIGRTVTENICHAMLTGYLFRLLRDLLKTIKYLKPTWDDSLQHFTSSETLGDLTVDKLVAVLRSPEQSELLWQRIANRPLVLQKGKIIESWLRDPKQATKQLQAHRDRLMWHISRLYRIRCCIVHGSPVRFPLALYAANLEFYLKQTLILALDTMHDYPHINDMASLFQRNVSSWNRRLMQLEANSANVVSIDEAIAASVVLAG